MVRNVLNIDNFANGSLHLSWNALLQPYADIEYLIQIIPLFEFQYSCQAPTGMPEREHEYAMLIVYASGPSATNGSCQRSSDEVWFLIELLLRFIAEESLFFTGPDMRWNALDPHRVQKRAGQGNGLARRQHKDVISVSLLMIRRFHIHFSPSHQPARTSTSPVSSPHLAAHPATHIGTNLSVW